MVNKDGSINLTYELNNNNYRVIATRKGLNNSVWAAVDTIRNETNGKEFTKTRKEWSEIFKSYIE